MSKDITGINTGRNDQSQDPEAQEVNREEASANSHNNNGTSAQEKVVLSDMASCLKSLEQKLAKQPDVDQNRVNRVRDAIHRGEYHVNPDRVADKMMGFEQDFKSDSE